MSVKISCKQPSPILLGLEWGSGPDAVRRGVDALPGMVCDPGNSETERLEYTGGAYLAHAVERWVFQFPGGRLHPIRVAIGVDEQSLLPLFGSIREELDRQYGLPARAEEQIAPGYSPANVYLALRNRSALVNALYTFGTNEEIEGSILVQAVPGGIYLTYQHEALNREAVAAEQGSVEKPGACFVATAALGGPHHIDAQLLRTYRDGILVNRWSGRRFITIYDTVGPMLAAVLRRNRLARALVASAVVRPALRVVERAIKRRWPSCREHSP